MDSSSCFSDPVTGNGHRYRKRCCGSTANNATIDLHTCDEDHDVVDCTPKECINIQCNCEWGTESFGVKKGICSSKIFKSTQGSQSSIINKSNNLRLQ